MSSRRLLSDLNVSMYMIVCPKLRDDPFVSFFITICSCNNVHHNGFLWLDISGGWGGSGSSRWPTRNPDVEAEAILTEWALGVPHVQTDKVAVRLVNVLNARIAHRARVIRIWTQCVCRLRLGLLHHRHHHHHHLILRMIQSTIQF